MRGTLVPNGSEGRGINAKKLSQFNDVTYGLTDGRTDQGVRGKKCKIWRINGRNDKQNEMTDRLTVKGNLRPYACKRIGKGDAKV